MIEVFCRGWRGSTATQSCRLAIRVIRGSFAVILVCSIPAAYAKCPVNENTTLVVRAETGDLQVETSGHEPVVEVQAEGAQIHESCSKDKAEYTGNGARVLKITTPKDIDLDLLTQGGNINIGDVDGNAVLRTSGGSVTTGNIRGNATITTQGGPIKSGNIGGNAVMRSPGTIEVSDVGGNAEFHTTAGKVTAGSIGGSMTRAEAGRTISIIKAGEVQATTNAGDISIGEASRINAKSGGGHITTRRVRGPFQGHTEQGDIRLDSAGSWVEASTGQGNILVHMVPENIDGDLHMDLQAGVGDVTVYLPQRMHASIDATVQRPAFQSQQIFSEFPSTRPPQGLIPNNRYYTATHSEFLSNGGGNMVVLHTSLGKISIRKN